MYGGAAMNLAAAVGKIPITVVTVGFLIIEIAAVHEVALVTSLRRAQLGLGRHFGRIRCGAA